MAYVALAGTWCVEIVQALVNLLRPDWAPIAIDLLPGYPRRDTERAAATSRGQVVTKQRPYQHERAGNRPRGLAVPTGQVWR